MIVERYEKLNVCIRYTISSDILIYLMF